MKKIYSSINPELLLHLIHPLQDVEEGEYIDGFYRNNVVPDDKFIQLATLKMNKGKTFKAHKHIYKDSPPQCIAQESWVVLRGSVKTFFYDIDDSLIGEFILKEGDCSLTFEGGHNYEILEDNTIVYEYKTGPYQGIDMDKKFLT